MYEEVKATVQWILSHVVIRADGYVLNPVRAARDRRAAPSQFPISNDQMQLFEMTLTQSLYDSFKAVWVSANPKLHQAYRVIHVTPQFPVNQFIKRAADMAGINYDWLGISDLTFTVWTDPGRVTVRYNDQDPVHVIYKKNRRRV